MGRALIVLFVTGLALLLWACSGRDEQAARGDQSPVIADSGRAGSRIPLWRAGYETGDLGHWPVNFCVASYSCDVSARPAAPQGRYSARYEVRPGDPKIANGCRAQSSRGVDYRAGEYWFRVRTRFPKGYRSSRDYWQVIHEWHEAHSDGGVDLGTFISSGLRPELTGESGPRFYRYWRGPSLATGVWHDFVYRIRFAREPSKGFVQVWLDGKRQRMIGGGFRARGATTSQGLWYPVIGIYQESSSDSACAGTPGHAVYMDDYLVGRTAASVGFRP